jgi:sugar/nucleoside kinase (ribokinase family)
VERILEDGETVVKESIPSPGGSAANTIYGLAKLGMETGFLYGLLQEKRLEECSRLGGLVARFSITKMGARQGLPTPTELSRHYREFYHKEL